MHPRLTSHASDAASSMIGKSMMLPEACSIAHVRTHDGRGTGARFMKKNLPVTPFGQRFITMARPARWGSSASARSR